MKKLLPLLSFFLIFSLTAQHQLTINHNLPRVGDQIIKQQVKYKDPGRQGANVLWDFSRLNNVNPEYKVTYYEVPLINDSIYIMGLDTFPKEEVNQSDLFIAMEHYALHYYRLDNNQLLLLGYGNPVNRMRHNTPKTELVFPFAYGDSICTTYDSDGIYSSREKTGAYGTINQYADAYGMLLLPSGDTIPNTLRVKTVTTTIDKNTFRDEHNTPVNLETESYRWYALGYRYPIFETKKITSKQDTLLEIFTTAFFYPPQEHLYLAEDPENLVFHEDNSDSDNDDLTNNDEILIYNYYPNPVSHTLHIEYYLKETANIEVSLYSMLGHKMWSTLKNSTAAGLYTCQIPMEAYTRGSYWLRFVVNGQLKEEVIVKK